MLIEYVGHHDEVEVDGHPELVRRGEPVEVADTLAGRTPSGHRADEDHDPGEGLLAQPTNWRIAGDDRQDQDDDHQDDENSSTGEQGTEPVDLSADLAKPPEDPPADTAPSATPEEH